MDRPHFPVPFPNAYWVIPEKLMAGAYPGSKNEDLAGFLDKIDVAISRGRRVYVHSQNGRGRVGLVGGCYLVRHGMTGDEALEWIRILRMAKPTGHLL